MYLRVLLLTAVSSLDASAEARPPFSLLISERNLTPWVQTMAQAKVALRCSGMDAFHLESQVLAQDSVVSASGVLESGTVTEVWKVSGCGRAVRMEVQASAVGGTPIQLRYIKPAQ